jgi:hypothetical protein
MVLAKESGLPTIIIGPQVANNFSGAVLRLGIPAARKDHAILAAGIENDEIARDGKVYAGVAALAKSRIA